jgi:putative ABC transport system permease protein
MQPPLSPLSGFSFPERCLVRALLILHPKVFRAEFQSRWLEFLGHQRREPRYEPRLFGPARFWIDVLKDLAASLPRIRREWRRPTAPNRKAGSGMSAVESIMQDLRFAYRTLARRPLFAGVAVLTLGLGIGAATAMFSVVDGVLLADIQYRDPARLMSIWQTIEGREGYTAAGETRLLYSQYRALQEESTAFEDVAVYAADWGESTLSGGSRPELVTVGATTASLLPVLGVTPILGRWFLSEEEGEGAGARAMVTVLSHDTWIRRYAGDRGILGRTVVLNTHTYTVVGVLPPGFRMQWLSASLVGADDPGPRDYWVPVGSPEWGEAQGSSMWEAVGRLAPGASLEHALVETSNILNETWDWGEVRSIILPRAEDEVRGVGTPLLFLLGATGLLLLIACGNVAALSLGEMHGRAQELATRAAIGAGRWRIVRQLMTESLVLGAVGSVLGAGVAAMGTGALVALAPPIPRIDLVGVDFTVLAFAAALGTLSGVFFGVAPAVITAREAAGTTLRSGGRAGSRRKAGLGRWVLAGEIGLTVMLVVASGLLVQSLAQLLDVPLGFDPEGVASVEVSPPSTRYEDRVALNTFMNEVLLEMEAVPGVTDVSAGNALPFPGSTSGWGSRLRMEDTTYLMPDGYMVAPSHLEFLGIPILEGRGIRSSDGADAAPVMVVSESLARGLWGDRSPVGQEMFYPMGMVTVVGVAGDVRQSSLQAEPGLTFYVPWAQHARSTLTFMVRTEGPAVNVLPAMREALWRVDSELAVTNASYLEEVIGDSAAEERYRTFLMSVFATLATVLAVVGIMGVTARHVAHRTREVGIRIALGAESSALLGGVVGEATWTGALGIGIGLLGAFWMGPLIASFLFGVGPFDPLTFAGVGALLLGVCAVASYIPARRLLGVDRVAVLKEE